MLKTILLLVRNLLILGTALAALLVVPGRIIDKLYSGRIHASEDAPSNQVAIVFGAGLRRDGRPTDVLADRIETALALYHAGLIEKILFSGSSRADGYNEPEAMLAYALEMGFDPADGLLDPGGDRTFLTCLRAREVFGIEKATLITQRFHLPRALVLCDAVGIEAAGVASDLRTYRAQQFWDLRESFATIRALWDAGLLGFRNAFRT